MVGGVTATAGNLVFGGEMNGDFDAFDAKSGRKLWSFNLGAGVQAPPVTYSVDGVQVHVAVAAGGNAANGNPEIMSGWASNTATPSRSSPCRGVSRARRSGPGGGVTTGPDRTSRGGNIGNRESAMRSMPQAGLVAAFVLFPTPWWSASAGGWTSRFSSPV